MCVYMCVVCVCARAHARVCVCLFMCVSVCVMCMCVCVHVGVVGVLLLVCTCIVCALQAHYTKHLDIFPLFTVSMPNRATTSLPHSSQPWPALAQCWLLPRSAAAPARSGISGRF